MPSESVIYRSDFFQQEVTLTVDENLNKLKEKVLALQKMAAANKSLRRLRDSLPPISSDARASR